MKYICDTCKQPTDNIRRYSDFLSADFIEKHGDRATHRCDDCERKLDEEIEFENEQYSTDEITCPACLHKFDDSWEYDENDGEPIKCPECGEMMELSVFHSTSYTTKRIRREVEG